MATARVTAVAAIEQIFAREHHHSFVKIEVEPFDKGLFRFGIILSFPLHITPKTPCSPLHPVLAIP